MILSNECFGRKQKGIILLVGKTHLNDKMVHHMYMMDHSDNLKLVFNNKFLFHISCISINI